MPPTTRRSMFEWRAVWRAAFEMTSSPVMIDPATYVGPDVLIPALLALQDVG